MYTISIERKMPEALNVCTNYQLLTWKVKWPLHFAFSYVYLVSQQNSKRSTSGINLSTMENMDNSLLQM